EPKPVSTAAAWIGTSASSAPSQKGAKTSVKQPMQIAASGQSARLSRDYRSTLLRLIERYNYYPLRARRNGLEGTSTVAFTVSSNGEIGGIALAQSSGMSLLDQAAVQTIKHVGKAPPFPAGIGRSKWRFVIPLAYNIR
ncbi:MAG: energy transducer TonB, partial [Gammaproteobacteria bacterium]